MIMRKMLFRQGSLDNFKKIERRIFRVDYEN